MIVTIHDPLAGRDIEMYTSPYLYKKWSGLQQKVIKKNSDRVYTVVGMERIGKSSWAFQQAKMIDHNFGVDRICFTPQQFLDTLKKTPPGGVVIFDEAFRGFSSKSSQSKVNKALVQAMMEVGKRNLIIFIILPSFNYLEPYIATHRSRGLFQIYEKATKNYRAWRFFNRKKQPKIYYLGKKNYGIFPNVKTMRKDRFFVKKIEGNDGKVRGYPYETFDLEAYEAKKDEAFNETPVTDTKDDDWKAKCLELRRKIYFIETPILNKKALADALEVKYGTFCETRRKMKQMNRIELENYEFEDEQALEATSDGVDPPFDVDNDGESAENSINQPNF